MNDRILTPEAYAELPDEAFVIGEDDSHSEEIVRPSTTYWHDVWQRFRRDKLALVGLVIIVIMTLMCIIMPLVSPYTYDSSDYLNMNASPSWAHPCGTDQLGRDQFIRIMYGARISLTIGFVAAAINFLIGVIYGGLAGYLGGRTDMILMRIVDILSSLPSLLYIVLIMLIFGSNIGSVILALCFTSWIGTARVHLLIHHLVPNAMGPIIVSTAFLIPGAIFSEAFLSFLGIGIQAPQASWGSLANAAIPVMQMYPHLMLFPVLAICVTMFSFNFIGDGLRDALDPRLKK